MTVDKISILRGYIKTFVDKANRLIQQEPWYEPPLDRSHIWAELVATVQYASDTLEETE